MTKLISLNLAQRVKDFVSLAQSYAGEISVSSQDSKYRVNGKSILGLFSLDLSQPVLVWVEKPEEAKDLFEKF